MSAVRAADAGEAVLEVTALEEAADGFVENRAPVAVLASVTVGVDGAELVKVFADEAMEVGFEGLSWAVDGGGFGNKAGQGGSLSVMG